MIHLDFRQAKANHLLFKSRLRAILYGEVSLDQQTVLSQYACALGKWIYSQALVTYEHITEVHELEQVHASIHVVARELVKLYRQGEIDQARSELSKMELIADRLVGLLVAVEEKVTAWERIHPPTEQEPVADTSSMLAELMAKNEQLDATIKQHILTEKVLSAAAQAERQVLRDFFMQAPAAHCILRGPEHVFELTNPPYQDLIGGRAVVGLPVQQALPELAEQGFYELLDSVFATGQSFIGKEMPIWLDNKSGTIKQAYLNFVYQPIKNTLGQSEGILVFAYEVTEQVLARRRLEEIGSTLRGAIDLADLGTWQVDLATNLLDYSQRLRGWFGIGPEEVITAERAYSVIRDEDRSFVKANMLAAIAAGIDGLYDVEYRVKATRAVAGRILRAQGQVHCNEQGQAYRVSGTVQDVTQQRLAQLALEQQVQQRTEELQAINEELLATNDALQASNKDLTELTSLLTRSNENLQKFAYVASHDLQEPLRKIQQFGDLLITRFADQLGEGVDYLNRMQAAASRMSTLIRDLLAYSRISTQRDTSESVSLQGVVSKVLTDLELVIEETGASIQVGALPALLGDDSQLSQLFQNLLTNALKFRRPDTAPVIQISASLVAADHLPAQVNPSSRALIYYRIDVADNGMGFDEKYLDRIFQVFQRLHGKNQITGTGIGLAICEKVVTNHGGAITATSQPGQGATFSVYLPV